MVAAPYDTYSDRVYTGYLPLNTKSYRPWQPFLWPPDNDVEHAEVVRACEYQRDSEDRRGQRLGWGRSVTLYQRCEV